MTGTKRTLVVVGLAVLAAASVAFISALVRKPSSRSDPMATAPPWARVEVAPRLQAKQRFTIHFETQDQTLDQARLLPSVSLDLWHNGSRTKVLLMISNNPNVLPGNRPIQLPAVQPTSGGPFTFRLPGLKPGPYTLCGAVGLEGAYGYTPFCEKVTIYA